MYIYIYIYHNTYVVYVNMW